MDSDWPGYLPSASTTPIDELLRGQECARKLKAVLSCDSINGVKDSSVVLAVDLLIKILNSFENTVSILNGVVDSDEVSKFPENENLGSLFWDRHRKYEESGETSKSTPSSKNRRGCYKRRKSSNSWTKDTSDLEDDGHAWRKYGQKTILKAKYPRNYFRCSHKYDQGCQATKQVQRIEDEPAKYRTTYYGHHTCKNFLIPSHHHLIIDSVNNSGSSNIISFTDKQHNNNNNNSNNHRFLTSFTSSSSIKQDYSNYDIVVPLSHDQDHLTCYNQSSSSDFLLSSPDHVVDVISGMNSSSTTSTNKGLCLDMDMIFTSDGHQFDDDVFESLACIF